MIKSIVALIDFSYLTRKVIDFSAEQAKAFGAELTLLHVNPEAAEKLYRKIDQGERDRRAQMLHFEHNDLLEKAKELRKLGLHVTPKLLEGSEIETILKASEKLHADMIIIGNHHHVFLHSFLLGSVGEDISKKVHCPVAMVS